MTLEIRTILLVSSILVLVVPLLVMIYYYTELRINDYLIFAAIPSMIIINTLTLLSPTFFGNFTRRAEDISFLVGILMVFLHIIRIRYSKKDGKIVKAMGFLIFGSLIMSSLVLDDLLFTPYVLVAHLFRIFVAILVIVTYLKIDVPIRLKRVVRAKYLWTFVGFVNLLSPVLSIITTFSPYDVASMNIFLNIVSYLTVIFIVITVPEAILISHVQIDRLLRTLYHQIDKVEEEETQYPLSVMINYIERVKNLSSTLKSSPSSLEQES